MGVAHGLTWRGWGFLPVSGVVTAVAAYLGQGDLLRVGVLLFVLPLLCLGYLWWAAPRVQVWREIHEPVTQVGREQQVVLRVRNPGRLPTATLLVSEQVPRPLGRSRRAVVPGLRRGESATVVYPVVPTRRGRWSLGPARLQVADPFGLARAAHSWQHRDEVLVRPRVHPLRALGLVGALSDVGTSSRLSAVGLGDRDLTVREYRAGDDRRHVHWKSSARRGRLMVRQEEQPHQPRATVLLDTGTAGGPGPGGPATARLEWAVEAAASICARLRRDGFAVRLVTDGRDPGWDRPTDDAAAARTMDRLALLGPGGAADLDRAADLLARGGDGVVVALLGGSPPPQALLRLPRTGAATLVLLLGQDVPTARALEHHGWSVVTAGTAAPVTGPWSRLVDRHRARVGAS